MKKLNEERYLTATMNAAEPGDQLWSWLKALRVKETSGIFSSFWIRLNCCVTLVAMSFWFLGFFFYLCLLYWEETYTYWAGVLNLGFDNENETSEQNPPQPGYENGDRFRFLICCWIWIIVENNWNRKDLELYFFKSVRKAGKERLEKILRMNWSVETEMVQGERGNMLATNTLILILKKEEC